MKVCHLFTTSQYAIHHGMMKPEEIVALAKSANMPSVALTDRMNLFGWLKFYRAALKEGIKPIIGCEVLVRTAKDRIYTVVVLVCHHAGYQMLSRLISEAYKHPHPTLGATIAEQTMLSSELTQGLIVLLGGRGNWSQIEKDPSKVEKEILAYQSVYQDRLYMALDDDQQNLWPSFLVLAKKCACPVVATHGIYFAHSEDFEAHEARVCIDRSEILSDPKRISRFHEGHHFIDQEAMCARFKEVPSALENTLEIAKRCNYQAVLNEIYLPDFPIPKEHTIDTFFSVFVEEAFAKKMPGVEDPVYIDRLREEIKVITSMNFSGYFLIVADFIAWAKENHVPVGPGRGSGAGSLVAYALGITDLDPIPYNLLFERFLNPERVSMPDFDIDFCMDQRDRVIQYVVSRYGEDNVAQIITYGTMAAKAVVRDVGRVLNHGYGFVDKLAKLVPFELGMTLKKALVQEPMLQSLYQQDEEVKTLLDLAMKLEGVVRHVGKHAGGVVIAPRPLDTFTPVYYESEGAQGITQLDKDDLEAIGLIKFDFLGLRTLTILDWTVESMKRHGVVENLDLNQLPLNDPKTYQLLCACQTTAVFQLESRGMKDLIRRLQPDCFEDIVALVALFRPGPLQSGMVDDFIHRKRGVADLHYFHPDLQPVLESTYGVILYQEQVMQIAQVLAGYSLGAADLLRRAMGKKKASEMDKQRSIFVEGAKKRSVDEALATTIFDLMEKFAGYGFNKSHSAAYALLSYQTAWLKANHPSHFMASVLSSDMDNTDKLFGFVQECQMMRLKLIPPHVNHSFYRFEVNKDGEIIYGLGAIKGLGQAVAEHIIASREQKGPYRDLFDFCQRLGTAGNKKTLEALCLSGALDGLGPNRATLFASLELASRHAQQSLQDQASGQRSLLGSIAPPTPSWKKRAEDSILHRLEKEREALGFYLSEHPFASIRPQLNHFAIKPLSEVKKAGRSLRLAGMVDQVKIMTNKHGKQFAFLTLSDESGQCEIAVFAAVFLASRDSLVKHMWLIVKGEVNEDSFSGGVRVQAKEIITLDQLLKHEGRKVVMTIHQGSDITDLKRMLRLSQDTKGIPIEFILKNKEGRVRIQPGKDWLISLDPSVLSSLSNHPSVQSLLVTSET